MAKVSGILRNCQTVVLTCPYPQKLAAHYDLSPRLLALMCSEPFKPVLAHTENKSRPRGLRQSFQQAHYKPAMTDESDDLEEQVELQGIDTSIATRSALDLNHYGFVDEVWHYNSVDWGDHCKGHRS